jgi:hypothetical protein
MYAPHFAAALAIKGRSPGAPLWALFVGAFIPDLVWIALARRHRAGGDIELLRRLFAFARFCRNSGDIVRVSFPPQGQTSFCCDLACRVLALLARFSGSSEATCPSPVVRSLSGMGSVGVGFATRLVGRNQRLVVAISRSVDKLLFVYASGTRRSNFQPAAVAATIALLIGIQLLTLFPCIGY